MKSERPLPEHFKDGPIPFSEESATAAAEIHAAGQEITPGGQSPRETGGGLRSVTGLPVPPEVLRMFFESAFSSLEKEKPIQYKEIEGYRKRLQFSIGVASVCQSWRAVAVDTSHLWTSICTRMERRRSANILEVLERFIERAMPRTICVCIDDIGRVNARTIAKDKALSILLDHVGMWKLLRVELYNLDALSALMERMHGQADNLMDVFLLCENANDNVELSPFQLHVPNLRSLNLWDARCFAIPFADEFSGLEELSLFGRNFEGIVDNTEANALDVMRFFEPLRNLRRLSLEGLECISDLHNPGGRALMCSLEHLSFTSCEADDVCIFLDACDCPKLETLLLDSLRKPRNPDVPIQLSDKPQFFPRLATLAFDIYNLRGTAVPLWLAFLDQFQRIEVKLPAHSDEARFSPQILLHLAGGDDTTLSWEDRLPRLESLEIIGTDGIDVDVLRTTVERRLANSAEGAEGGGEPRPSRIRRLLVMSEAHLPEDVSAWFVQNVEQFKWSHEALEDDSRVWQAGDLEPWECWMRLSFCAIASH